MAAGKLLMDDAGAALAVPSEFGWRDGRLSSVILSSNSPHSCCVLTDDAARHDHDRPHGQGQSRRTLSVSSWSL